MLLLGMHAEQGFAAPRWDTQHYRQCPGAREAITGELDVHAATIAIVGGVPLDRLRHAVPSFPSISEVWLKAIENYDAGRRRDSAAPRHGKSQDRPNFGRPSSI